MALHRLTAQLGYARFGQLVFDQQGHAMFDHAMPQGSLPTALQDRITLPV